jgi:hypothetical protein
MGMPKIVQCKEYFGPDTMAALEAYSFRYLDTLRTQLRALRTSRVTDMRRILEGRPKEEIKSFPWQYASNVVVQLVASFTDQMAARMVMGIHNTLPLWPLQVMGSLPAKLQPERKRELLEDFLVQTSSDPATMNILETEYTWFRNAIGYGCQALKVNVVEDESILVTGKESTKKIAGYKGPILTPVAYEDFLMPPEVMPVSRMPIKAQAVHLSRWAIMERIASGAWDKVEGEKILAGPTQTESDQPRKDVQSDQKISPSGTQESQVFTIYETHIKFEHNRQTFDCILTLYPETKACPKAIFRFYPAGIDEFLLIRFGGQGDRAYGLGLIEALQDYQEEVTQIHNQRRDAATCANTNVLRVTPGSQLDTMTTLYPMGIIPAPPGTLEWLQLGRNPVETIQDEQLVMTEAAQRAGVQPSFSGAGSGGPNKRGVYSAMGTMSVMQEGNSRTDMHLAMFRNAHVLLGETLLGLHAHFGVDTRILKRYGDDRGLLEEALQSYSTGIMQVRVKPANASVNREVEKQNLMMMMQNLRQHYQQAVQMLSMIENPMTPPDTKTYLAEALQGLNTMMRWAVRNFGIHEGGQSVVPQTHQLVEKNEQQQQQVKAAQTQQPPPPQGQQPPQPGAPPPNGAMPVNQAPPEKIQ